MNCGILLKKTLLKIKKKPRIYSLETSKYYNPPRRGGCVCVCMSGGGGGRGRWPRMQSRLGYITKSVTGGCCIFPSLSVNIKCPCSNVDGSDCIGVNSFILLNPSRSICQSLPDACRSTNEENQDLCSKKHPTSCLQRGFRLWCPNRSP